MGERQLPKGWAWTALGEACTVVMGQSPPSKSYNTEGVGLPFYQGKAEFGDLYPTPVKWCSLPGKIAEAGDILITVRAPVGPTNLCREKSCIGRGLAAIRPLADAPSRYWLYALRRFESELAEKATGTTFAAISGNTLRVKDTPCPLLRTAPYRRQNREPVHAAGRQRSGAEARPGQPQALQSRRAQSRVRRPVGAARPC